jgi:hypothetical protein
MTNLQELSDRIAIREVCEGYSINLTRRDWKAVEAAFDPDAVWRSSFGHDFRTRPVILENIRRLVETSEVLVHMPHGLSITRLTPGEARTTLLVNELARNGDGRPGITILGVYYDSLVKRDGRWLFAEREFRAQSIESEGPPAYVRTFPVGEA